MESLNTSVFIVIFTIVIIAIVGFSHRASKLKGGGVTRTIDELEELISPERLKRIWAINDTLSDLCFSGRGGGPYEFVKGNTYLTVVFNNENYVIDMWDPVSGKAKTELNPVQLENLIRKHRQTPDPDEFFDDMCNLILETEKWNKSSP